MSFDPGHLESFLDPTLIRVKEEFLVFPPLRLMKVAVL